MKRFIIGFGWLVAACVAVAGTGTSNEFRVDTRTGVRTAAATEKIQYSTVWATNDAAVKVEIAANGRMLFEGTDAGCYDWTPKRGGLYEFEHLTYDDEATVLDKLTAAFQVPDQPIAEDEVTVEAYAGTYDGKGHGLGVSGPEGAVFRFATAQGGPFVETLLFTNVCDVTVWYEVSGEGYLSLTNSSTVKIVPKSIEGATVILGDPLAYTGKEQRQTISQVTVDGLDVTYTVEGDSATEKGEHTMTLTGTGNFEGTVEKTYAIQDVAVSARQRYPWNGLVDLKFTVVGTAGTIYDMSFTAKDEIGGTNVSMKTLIREDGSASSATAAVSPGNYRWAWNAAADLPKDWICRGVSVSADANLRTYTVKFNANGGTGTMADEKFTYGLPQTLTANSFKKDGYMFAGWATSATGEKVYDDGAILKDVVVSGVMTLYACWREPGIVAWWKFDGNLNDYSGNKHTLSGSVSSWTKDRQGVTDGAMYCNGSVSLVPDSGLQVVSNLTISAWVKPEGRISYNRYSQDSPVVSPQGAPFIIFPAHGGSQKMNPRRVGVGVAVGVNGVMVVIHADSIFSGILVWQGEFAEKWSLVTVTISDNGAPILYVNGTQVKVGERSYYVEFVGSSTTGAASCVGGASYEERHYIGAMDDFRIYNRPLSPDEIKKIYEGTELK